MNLYYSIFSIQMIQPKRKNKMPSYINGNYPAPIIIREKIVFSQDITLPKYQKVNFTVNPRIENMIVKHIVVYSRLSWEQSQVFTAARNLLTQITFTIYDKRSANPVLVDMPAINLQVNNNFTNSGLGTKNGRLMPFNLELDIYRSYFILNNGIFIGGITGMEIDFYCEQKK